MTMPDRTIIETMDALAAHLDAFDAITRSAHATYRAYAPSVLVELDSRAQAVCTYCHMVAEADRRFLGRSGIRPFDIRGLKLWLFEEGNAVIRFKKMDEDGLTRNYPTKQAKDFDAGRELPGLPMPPVRLTAGYWLDETGIEFVRAQIAKPAHRKRAIWCAAIVPITERKEGERAWRDVTRQRHF
jgi:hypothetical protein